SIAVSNGNRFVVLIVVEEGPTLAVCLMGHLILVVVVVVRGQTARVGNRRQFQAGAVIGERRDSPQRIGDRGQLMLAVGAQHHGPPVLVGDRRQVAVVVRERGGGVSPIRDAGHSVHRGD